MTINKEKAQLSARKASGVLQKIVKMIEEDKYCPDIIQQIDAVSGLLKSTKKNLLQGHLDDCLEKRLKEDKNEAIEELIKIFDLSK